MIGRSLRGCTSPLAGPRASTAQDALKVSYDSGVTDEFVVPTVIVDESDAPVGPVRDGDSVIFFNFRGDRARQLTRAFNSTNSLSLIVAPGPA